MSLCEAAASARSLADTRCGTLPPARACAAGGEGPRRSTLYATLLLPEGDPTPGSTPLIVNPYGGPACSRWLTAGATGCSLTSCWRTWLRRASCRQSRYGPARTGVCPGGLSQLWAVQLEDQLTVLDAVLAQYPQPDKKRLGWWAGAGRHLHALCAIPLRPFPRRVAVAPVTDWRDYDSIYTERYMSQPAEFASGYRDFSVVNSAAALKGICCLRRERAMTTCIWRIWFSMCRR